MVETSKKGPHKRMLNLRQVLKIVPLGRTTLWKMEKEGRFPSGVFISDYRKVWVEDDILKWQASVMNGQSPRKPRRRSK